MMEELKFDTQHSIASHAGIAQTLLEKLIHGGFDATRMGAIEYGNNLMMPLFSSIPNSIFRWYRFISTFFPSSDAVFPCL